MSHTPGPWKIDGRYIIDNRDPITNVPSILATMHGDDSLMKGDAHLIAAAPDLLEFVQAVLHVSAHGPFDPSPLDENSPLMDQARDLIAKIEGQP